MRWVYSLLLFLAVSVAHGPANSQTTGRRALVIGNAKYLREPLNGALADARLVKGLFVQAGFQTTLVQNLGVVQLERAVSRFADTIRSGEEVALYYAGHGFEIRGENYLIPTDFNQVSEDFAARSAVKLEQVIDSLKRRGPRFVLMMIDACRNDPFSRSWDRSGGARGFVTVARRPGLYIAFSTAPKKKAVDKLFRKANGPFAYALSRHFLTPDVDIDLMFRDVKSDVLRMTSNRQSPYTIHNLASRWILVGRRPAPAPPSLSSVPPIAMAAGSRGGESVPSESPVLLPPWILQGDGAFEKPTRRFYAVGRQAKVGSSRFALSVARSNATKKMHSQINTFAAAVKKAVKHDRLGISGMLINETIKTAVAVARAAVSIDETFVDPRDGDAFARARLDLATLLTAIQRDAVIPDTLKAKLVQAVDQTFIDGARR